MQWFSSGCTTCCRLQHSAAGSALPVASCKVWQLCCTSVAAKLPAALCCSLQQVVHYLLQAARCSSSTALVWQQNYLLHYVAAWAALVWQLYYMTVLQCVFSICDFIAVKYGFIKNKKKGRQIFLSYCCNSLWTLRSVSVTTCPFF